MQNNPYIRKYKTSNAACAGVQPLSNLKYAVKDIIPVGGFPVSFGLMPPLIENAGSSANVINLLNDRGASLVGSTNLDPAAMSIDGQNQFYGDMHNPLDSSAPLGGSSGGSAIAVSLAEADFALGSDHGGSVRIPAALCNLYGLKLTPGLIDSKDWILLKDPMDCPGIIAKSPALIKKILQTITSLPPAGSISETIIVPHKDILGECSNELLNEFDKTIESLKDKYEIRIVEQELFLSEISGHRKIIIAKLFAELVSKFDYSGLPLNLQALLKFAEQIDAGQFHHAKQRCESIRRTIQEIIGQNLLLTPLFPVRKADVSSAVPNINTYLSIANVSGLPAINLNFDPPLQAIGGINSEIRLCEFALDIENR